MNTINSKLTNSFINKKIACFGDSITGAGDYPSRLEKILGATVYNIGFSRTRMSIRLGNEIDKNYDKFCMHNLAEVIKNNQFAELDIAAEEIIGANGPNFKEQLSTLKMIDFNNMDYLIIFYGTNDYYGSDALIGRNEDREPTTFKGAINLIVERILGAYPKINIVFITPTYRARFDKDDGNDSDKTPNNKGLYLIDYVDAIKEISELHHLPVLDLYRIGGINKYNHRIYLEDGLHPTAEIGYQHIANKIGGFLKGNF